MDCVQKSHAIRAESIICYGRRVIHVLRFQREKEQKKKRFICVVTLNASDWRSMLFCYCPEKSSQNRRAEHLFTPHWEKNANSLQCNSELSLLYANCGASCARCRHTILPFFHFLNALFREKPNHFKEEKKPYTQHIDSDSLHDHWSRICERGRMSWALGRLSVSLYNVHAPWNAWARPYLADHRHLYDLLTFGTWTEQQNFLISITFPLDLPILCSHVVYLLPI